MRATLVISIVCLASIALADDFKTANGNEYKNVTVTKQEPDGITVMNKKTGMFVKLYFTGLPKEVQQRFNYDPKKAAAYLRQKAKATRKNNEQLAKERADIHEWLGDQRQNVQTLQARYQQLQQQEADLLSQIGAMQSQPALVQIRSGRRYYSYSNPLRANLPSLQSQLSDVRREKAQVREQLEKTQH
jgi:TRAP-type C4-dicarboxylate transport system substrate-binding protein